MFFFSVCLGAGGAAATIASGGTLSRQTSSPYRTPAPPVSPPSVPQSYEPNYPNQQQQQMQQHQQQQQPQVVSNQRPNFASLYSFNLSLTNFDNILVLLYILQL